jgi:hypothetical protein
MQGDGHYNAFATRWADDAKPLRQRCNHERTHAVNIDITASTDPTIRHALDAVELT